MCSPWYVPQQVQRLPRFAGRDSSQRVNLSERKRNHRSSPSSGSTMLCSPIEGCGFESRPGGTSPGGAIGRRTRNMHLYPGTKTSPCGWKATAASSQPTKETRVRVRRAEAARLPLAMEIPCRAPCPAAFHSCRSNLGRPGRMCCVLGMFGCRFDSCLRLARSGGNGSHGH